MGNWVWRPVTGELLWSREHFHIFGLDPRRSGISYCRFFRMVHKDDRVRVKRAFQATVCGGLDFDDDYRIVRQDGVVRRMHSHACAVFGKSGELREYVGTVVDVTKRRAGEESSPVGDQDALDRPCQGKPAGGLTASIAHEVNQPLAAIVANANAALRWLAIGGPRISKARARLHRIVRDAERASDIVRRYRALGGKPVTSERVSMNSLIREVIALAATALRSNEVRLKVELGPRLPRVWADRVAVQQILLNLVMNAIEAMQSIDVRRRLIVINTALDASRVTAVVRDSGPGVAEPLLERVFNAFYTTKREGLGIGLTISRSIAEAHGGRLWAEKRSRSGGAAFHLELPSIASGRT